MTQKHVFSFVKIRKENNFEHHQCLVRMTTRESAEGRISHFCGRKLSPCSGWNIPPGHRRHRWRPRIGRVHPASSSSWDDLC